MIPYLNARRVHNILLYAAGIFTVLAVCAHDFKTCAIYAGFCGFAIGMKIFLNLLFLSIVAFSTTYVSFTQCDM